MFVPATPGSDLHKIIENIVNNKTFKLGMNVRVIESKVRDSLVWTYLSQVWTKTRMFSNLIVKPWSKSKSKPLSKQDPK